MASAAGFMSLVCYGMVTAMPLGVDDRTFFSSLPKFVLIVGVSLGSYVGFSYLFQLQETQPVLKRLQRFFFR